jgi:hypothetical protein
MTVLELLDTTQTRVLHSQAGFLLNFSYSGFGKGFAFFNMTTRKAYTRPAGIVAILNKNISVLIRKHT